MKVMKLPSRLSTASSSSFPDVFWSSKNFNIEKTSLFTSAIFTVDSWDSLDDVFMSHFNLQQRQQQQIFEYNKNVRDYTWLQSFEGIIIMNLVISSVIISL